MSTPHLLIDADVLRYRLGFACQHKTWYIFEKGAEELGPLEIFKKKDAYTEWLDQVGQENLDDFTIHEDIVAEQLPKCLHTVKLQIQAILNKFPGSDYTLYLSGKDNFRDKLVDYYKANRDRNLRPILYPDITEYLIKYWDAVVVDGMEADDALGIHQMKNYNYEMGMTQETCICTIDKDLDGIPGLHYNFVKEIKYELTPEEAMCFFYYQMLKGDGADNIPGLYKITGVKASPKLLEPLASLSNELDMWEYVVNVYRAAIAKKEVVMTDAELQKKLIEIGRLLWMWRKDNDLWYPPKGKIELESVAI